MAPDLDLETTFGTPKPVVGMVHLPPLPGAPRYDAAGGRPALREAARRDAERLAAAGVDAAVVENFGDAPFYPEEAPAHVVADLTALAGAVADAFDGPVGANVLRNDAPAAVAVAGAVGGAFVRANVHVGARVTDQGVLEGRAHETTRLREAIDADVAILADVDVKHSAPLAGTADGEFAAEAVPEATARGLADALIVTGDRTGSAPAPETVGRVADRADAPVFVGSGVTADTVGTYLSRADGVVVGTALKEGGETTAPVDPERAADLVAAADAVR